MAERHPGLTPKVAATLEEAAAVCLARHHSPPTEFLLVSKTPPETAVRSEEILAQWEPPNERALRSWANATDTTEAGACACVLAAVELMEELVAVARCHEHTGADYYLAPAGCGPIEDLEPAFRLEISGVDRGSAPDVCRRLRQKVQQVVRGDDPLPGLAGVVGFQAQCLHLTRVEQQ